MIYSPEVIPIWKTYYKFPLFLLFCVLDLFRFKFYYCFTVYLFFYFLYLCLFIYLRLFLCLRLFFCVVVPLFLHIYLFLYPFIFVMRSHFTLDYFIIKTTGYIVSARESISYTPLPSSLKLTSESLPCGVSCFMLLGVFSR